MICVCNVLASGLKCHRLVENEALANERDEICKTLLGTFLNRLGRYTLLVSFLKRLGHRTLLVTFLKRLGHHTLLVTFLKRLGHRTLLVSIFEAT